MMFIDSTSLESTPVGLERALPRSGSNTLERVRSLLGGGDFAGCDLAGIARQLCVSPRTLKRHLRQRGVSYRHLLDEARYRSSLQLMENPALTLEDVAERVGFSGLSNFCRAFRRWSGVTPSAFRAQALRHPAARTVVVVAVYQYTPRDVA